LAGLEAALGERLGQVALALADPPQRRLRVASNGRLDQLAKGVEQSRLLVRGRLAPGAGTANPIPEHIPAGAQFAEPTANRAARNPGRRRHRLEAAPACRRDLAGQNQSTAALVEKRRQTVKPPLDGGHVNHAHNILTNGAETYRHLDSITALRGKI
jgi:hypothetical protein